MQIVDVMPVTAAGVTVISPGVSPRYVAVSDRFALRCEQLQSELMEGPSLATDQTGEAIAVPDLTKDDRFGAFASQALDVGLAAMFTFPIADHRAGLARSLPGANDRHELHVEYQPIVSTVDGRLMGVEALLRWSHPSRGSVPPTVFVPFAEQSSQIVELGRWVLEQACSDRANWQSPRPDQLVMSVHVSSHQLLRRQRRGGP